MNVTTYVRPLLLVIVLLPALAVAGASRPATKVELDAIRKAMETKLKDAQTARFLNVTVGKDGSTFCGEVNAKNSFAAYGGYHRFFGSVFIIERKHVAIIMSMASEQGEEVTESMCAKYGL